MAQEQVSKDDKDRTLELQNAEVVSEVSTEDQKIAEQRQTEHEDFQQSSG
jgi:hypothetical protein